MEPRLVPSAAAEPHHRSAPRTRPAGRELEHVGEPCPPQLIRQSAIARAVESGTTGVTRRVVGCYHAMADDTEKFALVGFRFKCVPRAALGAGDAERLCIGVTMMEIEAFNATRDVGKREAARRARASQSHYPA